MRVIQLPMSEKAVEGFKASGFELYEEYGSFKVKNNNKVIAEFGDVKRLEKFFERVYEKMLDICN